jgi:phage portal protein BeeE
VPKIILGYTEGVNYSNANQQYTKYIENTIRPIEGMIAGIFTTLLKDFGQNLIFVVNDEHIDDFEQRTNISIKLVQNGIINRNEARHYVGYATEENDMLNQFTITTNTQLLDTLPNTEAV